MSEENKALLRRGWQTMNGQRNVDSFDEFYATDVVCHEPDRELHGLEEVKQYAGVYLAAFPDLSATLEDVIAEGDKVVSRYTYRGTHQGETEELGPPTGKHVEIEGITIHRIEDGKIVEEWERFDNLSAMQQLGLIPEQ